ncbi:MAG: hypothetical protein IKP19_06990 [Oscillospiraceae bacterium]|nr:hypothetical protein [Oscillospiraceae bacterium]
MAQKPFYRTYQLLMQYFEPDPERSGLALRRILRMLAGTDPPKKTGKTLQPKTGCAIMTKNSSQFFTNCKKMEDAENDDA